MPQITFLHYVEGVATKSHVREGESGKSILQIAQDNKIEIENACGGVCACTTCHCIIREGFTSLKKADEIEEDHLDRAWGIEPLSRLSCQTKLGSMDLTVEIPKYSRNHASEKPH